MGFPEFCTSLLPQKWMSAISCSLAGDFDYDRLYVRALRSVCKKVALQNRDEIVPRERALSLFQARASCIQLQRIARRCLINFCALNFYV